MFNIKYIILLLFYLGIHQLVYAQQENVYPFKIGEELSVEEFVRRLEKTWDIEVVYSSNTFPLHETMKIDTLTNDPAVLIGRLARVKDLDVLAQDNRFVFIKNYRKKPVIDGKYYVSGFIRDGHSGEKLVGATILEKQTGRGTVTNDEGYFSLDLSGKILDTAQLILSYVAYAPLSFSISSQSELQSDFYLFPDGSLGEVTVIGSLMESKSSEAGFLGRKTNGQQFLPGSLGGQDLLNELTFLPGINKGNEFQAGVSIRGLDASNTQYLLDGLPLYASNHVFGMRSVIDHNALQNVQLFKRQIPLQFPGSLSGVINNQLKSGSVFNQKGSLGISQDAVHAHLEGPLINKQSSFYLGARQSIQQLYLPSLLDAFTGIESLETNFRDVVLKMNHQLSPLSFIEFMLFHSKDHHLIKNDEPLTRANYNFDWSNLLMGIKWHFITGDRLAHSLQLGMTRYHNNKQVDINGLNNGDADFYYDQIAQARISDFIFRQNLDFYYNSQLRLKSGWQITRHQIRPLLYRSLVTEIPIEDPVFETKIDSVSLDLNLYGAVTWDLNERFQFSSGCQLNYFRSKGSTQFLRLNPYASFLFRIVQGTHMHLNFQRAQQNVHLLQGPQVGIVSDLWMQANALLPPQEMWQVSTGFDYLKTDRWRFELEVYRRWMDHLVSFESVAEQYDPGFSDGTVVPIFVDPVNWQDRVRQVSGDSYGLETSVGLRWQNIKLTASYALAYTRFYFMDDRIGYPGNQDYRHSGHLYGQWKVNSQWMFYGSWQYHSGGPFTLPQDGYLTENGEWVLGFGQRNNQRFQSFHQATIGIKFDGTIENLSMEIDFGIRNLYNHLNPVFNYLSAREEQLEVRQVNGLPIHPFFSCRVLF